jgi:hypothetical protein
MMSNHDFSDDSTQLLSFSSWFGLRFMMFNATFNNISVISWRSVLLVEEAEVPGENHRHVADKLYHTMLSSTPRNERGSNS